MPLGIATGVFIVPIQVFLQARPPDEQKGRMIATQAFCNWVAISAAALVYFGLEWLIYCCVWPRSALFAITALLLVPIAFLYQLPHELHPDRAREPAN
jgi:acyl-[acyl-carrier-protein]-phospholipid O-acyltransferase/long-chain-fatty-acid--[acyl-carrier-protein] ligase